MKRSGKKVERESLAIGSSVHCAFGLIGLLLIALGAVLPSATGSWAFTILLLPSGTLMCGGVGLLQRERPLSPAVVTGMTMVAVGVVAAAVLALFTAEPFSGLRIDGDRRRFRMPIWHELLALHLLWTTVAAVITLGIRLIARPKIERDLAVALLLIATFPLIGILAWGLHSLQE